ncbi:putative chromatin remodeling & transcription regulator BTB-POZ family protein, partial [Tanacetum coccineum]
MHNSNQIQDRIPSPEHSHGGFAFAFNDSNFSDRILRIEIVTEPLDSTDDGGDGCSSLADWARNRKRRRADIKKDNLSTAVDVAAEYPEEQILNQPDDGVDPENQDEDPAAMIEEPPLGINHLTVLDQIADAAIHISYHRIKYCSLLLTVDYEAANDNDLSWNMECSTVVRVETLHISSPILAARSPYFYKLFSNGTSESEERYVTVRINASEEAALMELLNFIYSNTLTANTAPALLDVLMAADKFE